MADTTHIRITERDKQRLNELADSDESQLMALRAAINALAKEREE
jgi:hypothetical protein